MDLEELNKQMNMFNVDYYKEPTTLPSQNTRHQEEQWKKQQMVDYQQRINEINFTPPNGNGISNDMSNPETILAVQQIKRPTKSDSTRNEINSKMAALNSFLPPSQPPAHSQPHLNSQQNAHTQPLQLERKTDYRQNVNSRIDNFIFDNPIPIKPNPILQQYEQQYQQQNITGQSGNGFYRDSRMVIQDSNKDFYRQEANNRMAEYSPLSRASNCPISMANLSVNDFYNATTPSNNQWNEEDARAVLNNRLSNYAPLAATINLNSSPQSLPSPQSPPNPLDNIFNATRYNPQNTIQQSTTSAYTQPPKTWNNINLPQQNAVFTEHPVYSNSGNKRG
jgi:hypothetical protein